MINYKNIFTKELLIQKWVKERKSQKEIAIEYGVHVGTIETYIKKLGLTGYRERQKYPVNKNKIDRLNPIYWYFVGLTISDGHLDFKNNRIIISLVNDEDILLKLSEYFSTDDYTIPVHRKVSSNNSVIFSLYLTGQLLLLDVAELLNITADSDKTKDVCVPTAPNKNCGLMLLRGIIDGDGSIKNSAVFPYMELYSHSINMVKSLIVEYKRWCKIELSKYKAKNLLGYWLRCPVNTLSVIEIYEHYPDICLLRKRNKVKKSVDDIVHHYEIINHSNW